MVERALTRSVTRGWSALPTALRIGILYLAARLVTTALLLLAGSLSGPSSRFGVAPSLGEYVVAWDAQWYWFLAVHGYPTTLPLTDLGQVAENQWAFMPIYAYLSAAVGAPFGSWGLGAFLVAFIAGYFACLALYRLLRLRQDRAASTWAVLFFAAGPLAALFQVGYGESLFLLWLFLALWCVSRRRFGWVYLLIPLMGYTRPGVLAFALFLGLFGIWRWFTRRRDPLPVREIMHIVALGGLAVLVGFSWQILAGVATGDPSAYLSTELAWRRNWLSESIVSFVPFEGMVQGIAYWFDMWGLGAAAGFVIVGLGVSGLVALLLFSRHVRAVGVEVRLWSASYLLYLFAVFFPQSSVFRLLVPLSPLWGAVAAPRSTVYRGAVLALCLAGQWWWIYNMYALGNTYWQIP